MDATTLSARLEARDFVLHHGSQPRAAHVFSTVLSLLGISILSSCFSWRSQNLGHWKRVPLARWLILAVYADSWLFVISSSILQSSFGLNSSEAVCGAAILLCLVFYLSSKVIIYFFLVEKVYIIRGRHINRRRDDKLYLFNTLGMLLPYGIVICLTFVFRVTSIAEDKQCYIGMKLAANIPLLVLDATINVYLTSLFLIPLVGTCSFDHNPKLRAIAKRTFIGSAATLTSSIGNLVTLLVMRGHQPGWLCFACCNADVVFSAAVLHWVTSRDSDNRPPAANETDTSSSSKASTCKCTSAISGSRCPSRFSTTKPTGQHGNVIWAGQLGETTTEIIAEKRDKSTRAISPDGITVTVDRRLQIETNSSSGSTNSLTDHRELYRESLVMADLKVHVTESKHPEV